MISFAEAKKITLDAVRRLPVEEVPIEQSLNRILAEDIYSDIDIPLFDKSAVDGYACREEDLGKELELLETIGAGLLPKNDINAGQCSKLTAGALLPKGADCVVKLYDAEQTGNGKIKLNANNKDTKDTKANICYKGEDAREGDLVLKAGTIIKPQHIAVMSMAGAFRPKVSMQPKVGLISAGIEIVEPFTKPQGHQIRNSNSYQLFAQIEAMGCRPRYFGISRDDKNEINQMFSLAIRESDVLIVSGGLSMGDFDYVPMIIENNDIKILFNQVAIKPGRPTKFGVSPNCFVFALPGNPISTFLLFEVLIKPFLYGMMGNTTEAALIPMILGETLVNNKKNKRRYIPVRVSLDGKVFEVPYNGSAHIEVMSSADGFIAIPPNVSELKEGSTVMLIPI